MKFKLSSLIDHTNLKANSSFEEITQLVKEAREFSFNSICIRPNWLNEFANQYKCSAVISFPQENFNVEKESDKEVVKAIIGGFNLEAKDHETQDCLNSGALELDPVIDLSRLSSFQEELYVYKENIIAQKQSQEEAESIYLKPIFSCEILSEEELEFSIAKYSEFARNNQNEKIRYCYKNSTGFIKSNDPSLLNTTSEKLIKSIAQYLNKYDKRELITIKAAGGIRTKEEIEFYYNLCAGRLSHIGTSSGVNIFS